MTARHDLTRTTAAEPGLTPGPAAGLSALVAGPPGLCLQT
jgi:hypothetical protein